VNLNKPNDERGFIHKKILGLAGGVVKGFLGGGPIGAIGGAIGSFAPKRQTREFQRQPQPIPGVGGAIERFLPGGRTGFFAPPQPTGPGGIISLFPGVPGGVTGFAQPEHENGTCPPRGFHKNKSSYFLRDGTFVPRGSRFVRNRRLNNANGRAQDKAITRLEKGQDHAKKLLKSTGWRTISKQSSKELRNAKKAACK